jgi:hypothetical protein
MQEDTVFTIPAITLSRVINYLGERPFKEVAPLMSLIDQTAKVSENAVQRSEPKRTRGRPKS